jgi:hypothetical protein
LISRRSARISEKSMAGRTATSFPSRGLRSLTRRGHRGRIEGCEQSRFRINVHAHRPTIVMLSTNKSPRNFLTHRGISDVGTPRWSPRHCDGHFWRWQDGPT